jgi:hypothetical protein
VLTAVPAQDPNEQQALGRFEWERIMRRARINWDLKSLGLLMATWADPDGTRVRPGVKLLVAVTGTSPSTVGRRIKELHETYLLLQLVRRGGGRGGQGSASEWRLAIPVNLLDRIELLPPEELLTVSSVIHVTDQSGLPSVTQMTDQSDESPVIHLTGRTPVNPVDNSRPPIIQVTDEHDFHRSNRGTEPRLSGQIQTLIGHPGDQLPATTNHQLHHPPTELPAQPPTARDPSRTSQNDHGEVGEPAAASPTGRCAHGLPVGRRPDGSPACALCRRTTPPREPP